MQVCLSVNNSYCNLKGVCTFYLSGTGKSMPLISVIMSTYNESELLLKEAIDSILNQTLSDFEFIIIQDNPENEVHASVISKYASLDARVKYYLNEKNMGLTASLNRGLSFAQGIYICRMDADDISLATRFEKQLNYLEKNQFDLIGGIPQMINENGEVMYSIKSVPTNLAKIKKVLKYGQCVAHPTWFGKKEVFDKLDGYRNMPLCEDYDFTLRAILAGYRISNLNEVVLKYRMTANSVSRSNLYEQYLFMKYITQEYGKGDIADIASAHQFVKEKNKPSISRRYLKANVYFNTMLENMENKQLFSFVWNGIKIVFTSSKYVNKIYRFFILTLNS